MSLCACARIRVQLGHLILTHLNIIYHCNDENQKLHPLEKQNKIVTHKYFFILKVKFRYWLSNRLAPIVFPKVDFYFQFLFSP